VSSQTEEHFDKEGDSSRPSVITCNRSVLNEEEPATTGVQTVTSIVLPPSGVKRAVARKSTTKVRAVARKSTGGKARPRFPPSDDS